MKHKSDTYLGTYLIWVRILFGYVSDTPLNVSQRESRGSASDRPIQRKGRLYRLFGGLLGWNFLVSSSFLFYFPFPTINMH